jgi:hypothetical protein
MRHAALRRGALRGGARRKAYNTIMIGAKRKSRVHHIFISCSLRLRLYVTRQREQCIIDAPLKPTESTETAMTTKATTIKYFWIYHLPYPRRRPLTGVFARTAKRAIKRAAKSQGIPAAHLTASEA